MIFITKFFNIVKWERNKDCQRNTTTQVYNLANTECFAFFFLSLVLLLTHIASGQMDLNTPVTF